MWATLVILALGAHVSHCNVLPLSVLNTTKAATKTSDVPSTITSPPTNDAIAINTCSYFDSEHGETLWNSPYCSMYAGTVDLVFWPTDNKTYPKTYYDSENDYTYKSPSVYMIVNTLYGWNACGPLGPSTSRAIFGFDLTEVSTLAPYTDESVTTRRDPKQLQLSDLGTHCTRTSYNKTELATQTHPMDGDDTRCNPFLVVPIQAKRFGYPYWKHCGVAHNKFGLFDPPYAIPAVDALVPGATTTANPGEDDRPASATVKATVPSPQAPTSAVVSSPSQPTADSERKMEEDDKTLASSADPIHVDPPSQTASPDGNNNAHSSAAAAAENSGSPNTHATNSENKSNDGSNKASLASGNSETKNAQASPSGDAASSPSFHTDKHGNTVIEDANNPQRTQAPNSLVNPNYDPNGYSGGIVSTVTGKQVVSLGTAGLEIVNPDTGSTSTYVVPAAGASATGRTSIVPATVAVYGDKTVTLGGPAVTVSGVVVVSPKPTTTAVTNGTTSEVSVSNVPTVPAVAPSSATRLVCSMYLFIMAFSAVCVVW